MVYTIKSKNNLEELIDILKEEGVLLRYQDTKMIEYQPVNEKDFDIFTNILSFYVAYINFREQLELNLIKQGENSQRAKEITEEVLIELKSGHYFFTLTRVLVKEYFKKMQTLNIESFSLFNMKGLKEEIKQFAEKKLQAQQQSIDDSLANIPDGEEVEMGMQDTFTVLNKRAKMNGLPMEDFKELHVFQQNNFLVFENKKGEKLDNEFFLNYLGSVLEFEIMGEVENPEIFEGVMTVSVLVNIFDITKIVVHQSLSENAKDILLYNVSSLKKETGKKIKVIMCNGCKKCE